MLIYSVHYTDFIPAIIALILHIFIHLLSTSYM